MSEIKLQSFPSSEWEALTMLYLQKQDLSDKTPEELVKMYWETYFRIAKVSGTERKNAKEHFN